MDKRKRYKIGLVVAIVAVYCFLIQPFIVAIIGGLVGSIIALAIGLIAAALTPAAIEKLAHIKYGALKAVISRDPINALYRRLEERKRAQEDMRMKVLEQTAALSKTKRRTAEMIKQYPTKAEQYNARLIGFERLLAHQVDLYKKLKAAVELFTEKLEEAEAEYEMAVLFNETSQIMGGQEDFEKQLREKFAFDAIDKEVDMAMANMSMALIDIDHAPVQITATQQHAINYDASGNVVLGNILEPVKVIVK